MRQLYFTGILGVVAAVGGVGVIVAANHFGSFSGNKSNVQAASASTCPHEIAAERCPFCHPELIESMGWCGGHDVAEALCTRCNSELIPAFKVQNDWCAEHGLPESQCALCGGVAKGPEVVQASLKQSDAGSETMRANRAPSETCTNAFLTVQLKSPEISRRAGFEFAPVRSESIHETIVCNAQIAFDGNRYAHLASRAPGTIAEVSADLGDRVEAGDMLAVIDSAELGSAKAAYLQARSLVEQWQKNEVRERSLFEKNVGTEKDVLEAETKLVESRVQLSNAAQRLKTLGLSDDDIAGVVEANDTSSRLELKAPFSGVIVERHAVHGEVVSTTEPLFALADITTMWVMLDVYEADVARLREGQPVTISVDAMPNRTFEGTLAWVSAHVDPKTRTIRARAEVDNSEGLLRANMFGRAEVQVRSIENAVLVPESAVQWDGCCNLVFVRQTDTVFQPYKVTLGYKRDGHYVVERGLPAGESVVTQGSFLLKTELMKGNIGAGCCEVDPGAGK